MPAKSKASAPIAKPEPVTSKSRRPSLRFLGRVNVVYLLFFLLIVAAFLIGVLYTKVEYLQKGGTTIGAGDLTANDQLPPQPVGPVDVDEGHLPILGNKDAKVTVIEFSDFQCPFCKTLFDESFAQIKKDYIDTGKIKFAYRHYPLTEIHPNAQKAAEAAECANEQENFWDFHDELFKNQTDWEALDPAAAQAKFVEYANTIGLNGTTLDTCITSGDMAEKVTEDANAGVEVGVDGTPATFINGILISGAVPYNEFKTEIDKALEEN